MSSPKTIQEQVDSEVERWMDFAAQRIVDEYSPRFRSRRHRIKTLRENLPWIGVTLQGSHNNFVNVRHVVSEAIGTRLYENDAANLAGCDCVCGFFLSEEQAKFCAVCGLPLKFRSSAYPVRKSLREIGPSLYKALEEAKELSRKMSHCGVYVIPGDPPRILTYEQCPSYPEGDYYVVNSNGWKLGEHPLKEPVVLSVSGRVEYNYWMETSTVHLHGVNIFNNEPFDVEVRGTKATSLVKLPEAGEQSK